MGNGLGIAYYRWDDFGVRRSKVKIRVRVAKHYFRRWTDRREFALYRVHRRNLRGVPVQYPHFLDWGTVPPLFRTQAKNLLSSEVICED